MHKNIFIKNSFHNIAGLKVGRDHSTKIVSNIGLSPKYSNLESELEKAILAESYGANILGDHTITSENEIILFHKMLIEKTKIPISTVPIYQVAIAAKEKEGAIIRFSDKEIINTIEQQAKIGIDIMTLHASLTIDLLKKVKSFNRRIEMTSRGGTWLAAHMLEYNLENPLLKNFDTILDICKHYNITISLGPSLRTATIVDEIDELIREEIEIHALLVKKAIDKNVNIMVEYGGHIKYDQIPDFIKYVKEKTYGVPIRPLITCTDIAAGWDHIGTSIAQVPAAIHGADLLVVMTRAEHLGLPRIEDIIEGIISMRIAAHIADTVKFNDYSKDESIALARKKREWDSQWNYFIDPIGSKELYTKLNQDEENQEYCSMCGDLCAHKIFEQYCKTNN